jgi:DNA-binding HxlR family transcriptional regulator
VEETLMNTQEEQKFSADCACRVLFEQIADKWSMMVLSVLDDGPMRFNAIKRRLEGVTQKALTECLRRLERNGLISRRVIPTSPIGVEYEITALGRLLLTHLRALYNWTHQSLAEVNQARTAFDGRKAV